jgi:hypothetical protein
MANLLIDERSVTVSLSALEKLEALHGNVTVARSAVERVRIVPDGMAEVHGTRRPGTTWPGVIMVGTWRGRDGVTFAVCHGRGPAVVLQLTGQRYSRIVVTTDDPEAVVANLR